MNFKDIGIIIAKKPLKESLQLITVFTKNHGLYSGVIRSSSKKSKADNSIGNMVDFFWQARLHEHLGSAKCEIMKSYGAMMITDKTKLYALNSIVSLIKAAFHEREPHNNFFPELADYLHKSIQSFNVRDYIILELSILSESGYSLQLDECAVTGSALDLHFVSPKSGKAVSRNAGLPYADKLLILPNFIRDEHVTINSSQLQQAFNLTGYFFNRYFFQNNPLPDARQIFIEHIQALKKDAYSLIEF